ncbi:MAG TPA: hypothetical protein VFX74_06350, partial [Candidatus Limnocylindria bacterium]|nr:hypothetical protein [Candidatus Limnocylindria bacterium]
MTSRRGSATRRRRTTRRRRRAASTVRLSGRLVREVLAWVLVFLAVVSVIALFAPRAGAIIEPWHDVLSTLLGWGIAFAGPLLAGFALMLWMKAMPAERWMAVSGAIFVALALLGIFQLVGDGGGAIGSVVAGIFNAALGEFGAWIALGLLLIAGLLLYFNMTVGDVVAAYLERREDRAELAEAEARRVAAAQRRSRPDEPEGETASGDARPGLLQRVRGAFGGTEQDEPPLIVRRQRPDPVNGGRPAPNRAQREAFPAAPADAADDGADAPLAPEEDALLAASADGAEQANDAALEATQRAWDLPRLELLA